MAIALSPRCSLRLGEQHLDKEAGQAICVYVTWPMVSALGLLFA